MEVLDPAQLKRIESVHRGFFYQHLYAVALILAADSMGVTSVRCERDEDIELVYPDKHLYIQVKTRSAPLVKSDISDALDNFDAIKAAHADGSRDGEASFAIVANVELGPVLATEYASSGWRDDCVIVRPEAVTAAETVHDSFSLPGPFSSIEDVMSWCAASAAEIPYMLNQPETLVWKLASIVQYLSTGPDSYPNHSIDIAAAKKLFNQLVVQLQMFPEVPTSYRPHQNEPQLESPNTVRLIVGHSGSGKTCWASQAATHSESDVAYFNVAGMPDGTIAPSLTRELAAKWLGHDANSLGSVLMPGMSSIDSLRVLDSHLGSSGHVALVVIDNVHAIENTEIRTIVESCSNIRFILLAQPWSGRQELEAQLGIEADSLQGWSNETIAREFSNSDMPVTPHLASRIAALTGGLPLYVLNSIALAKADATTPEALCDALESGSHTSTTAQEALLSRTFKGISNVARDSAAAIGLASTPLNTDLVKDYLAAILDTTKPKVSAILRELKDGNITQSDLSGRIALHDSFRILAVAYRVEQGEKFEKQAASVLRDKLLDSGLTNTDPSIGRLVIQLLPITGDIQAVVDLATDEFFLEFGFGDEFAGVLEKFARDPDNPAEERFWALDGLAFSDLSADRDSAKARVIELEAIVSELPERFEYKPNLLIKKIQLAGQSLDQRLAVKSFREAMSIAGLKDSVRRIIRYNYAVALFKLREYRRSARVAEDLIVEYYGVVGLNPDSIVAKSNNQVVEMLGDRIKLRDDIKHLADSLCLYADATNHQRLPSVLARHHALKFYVISQAISSTVKVGQDIVDEYLGILKDPEEARTFMEESLIPHIEYFQLLAHLIPVKAQYAVVLAYCGDSQSASDVMDGIEVYKESLPAVLQHELEQQRVLIQRIDSGTYTLASTIPRVYRG